MSKKLGKKIKQARTEMGLTQADLAYRLGISATSISAFEAGRIKPDFTYLQKIAQFTHQPIYFFTGKKVEEALDRIDKMITELQQIKQVLKDIDSGEE